MALNPALWAKSTNHASLSKGTFRKTKCTILSVSLFVLSRVLSPEAPIELVLIVMRNNNIKITKLWFIIFSHSQAPA